VEADEQAPAPAPAKKPTAASSFFGIFFTLAFIVATNYGWATGRLWCVWAILINLAYALFVALVLVGHWRRRRAP
jgi:hypothetical protein